MQVRRTEGMVMQQQTRLERQNSMNNMDEKMGTGHAATDMKDGITHSFRDGRNSIGHPLRGQPTYLQYNGALHCSSQY